MWLTYLPPDRIHHFVHYMKRMGSENDKARSGVWNEAERSFEGPTQGSKSLKRQKSAGKPFVWADELKRQFSYTLKPSKCSNTDIPKFKSGNGEGHGPREAGSMESHKVKSQNKSKFFADMSLENIFLNSEYFKLKSGNTASVSFCSGENGENRWTIDTKSPSKKITNQTSEENPKTKKINVKKTESLTQAELKYLKNNIEAVLLEVKQLNRDFGSVRMGLKTIEKVLRLQKQVLLVRLRVDKVKKGPGPLLEEVGEAAQETRDFIDDNQKLLVESEGVPESPDIDKIISNLHRLSETAYQPKIIQTSMGAKFEAPRELPISFYADGILLRNKEFRKFTDLKAGLFLRDIEDGFFPSELWPEYQYGVPFQVTDRRFELFDDGNSEYLNRFPGNGRRLGTVFDGTPATMVYLEHEKPRCLEVACGEPEKKRINTFFIQNNKHQPRVKNISHSNATEDKNKQEPGDVPKLLSLKVRLGMGGEDVIQLSIMSNEKMSRFQDVLFRKLCERYHEEYVKDADIENDDNGKCGEAVPDFEIHAYGRKPFRLSEKLNLLPSECGIVDNCVVNITEI